MTLDKHQVAALARHGATEADTQPKQKIIEELEKALLELAQYQSDLEDAIIELAEMIGG